MKGINYICTKNRILMDILSLLGGLLLILLGANGLTDGAASIAKRFRIPSIVIGLTIVAFGARHRFSFVRTEKTDCNDGSAKRKMLQRRAAPFPGIR